MAANCRDTTSTMIKLQVKTTVILGPWLPTPWISQRLQWVLGIGNPWSSSSKWSSARSARPRKTSEPTGPNGKRRRWKHRRTNRFLDVWLVQLWSRNTKTLVRCSKDWKDLNLHISHKLQTYMIYIYIDMRISWYIMIYLILITSLTSLCQFPSISNKLKMWSDNQITIGRLLSILDLPSVSMCQGAQGLNLHLLCNHIFHLTERNGIPDRCKQRGMKVVVSTGMQILCVFLLISSWAWKQNIVEE